MQLCNTKYSLLCHLWLNPPKAYYLKILPFSSKQLFIISSTSLMLSTRSDEDHAMTSPESSFSAALCPSSPSLMNKRNATVMGGKSGEQCGPSAAFFFFFCGGISCHRGLYYLTLVVALSKVHWFSVRLDFRRFDGKLLYLPLMSLSLGSASALSPFRGMPCFWHAAFPSSNPSCSFPVVECVEFRCWWQIRIG